MGLERYGREPGGMELIQQEIETRTGNVKLACTPDDYLLPTAIEAIVGDSEK